MWTTSSATQTKKNWPQVKRIDDSNDQKNTCYYQMLLQSVCTNAECRLHTAGGVGLSFLDRFSNISALMMRITKTLIYPAFSLWLSRLFLPFVHYEPFSSAVRTPGITLQVFFLAVRTPDGTRSKFFVSRANGLHGPFEKVFVDRSNGWHHPFEIFPLPFERYFKPSGTAGIPVSHPFVSRSPAVRF